MDANFNERVCRCALNRLMGFEPFLAQGIIGKLGSATAFFSLTPKQVSEVFGPFFKHASAVGDREVETSRKELEMLAEKKIVFLTELDEEYPPLLRECEDRPVGLYTRGDVNLAATLSEHPPVAIVGTRDISFYGKEWTRKIVDALSRARIRPTIVSGMAMGCDYAAHEAALEAGLPTVGVLPTCVDRIYPSRHASFAARLAARSGCALVSDYPSGTSPLAINFIRRNRIIAGMAGATVLVESKASGGGLITVRMASSYGRDVFALPGRADDVRSAGCNAMLQAKIAEPVFDLDVFVDSLGLGTLSRRRKVELEQELRVRYSTSFGDRDLERLIAVALHVKKKRGVALEELCSDLGMTYPEAVRFAGQLEADGIIEMDLLQRCAICHNFV